MRDIGKYIDEFKHTKTYKHIQLGNAYYDSENTEIMNRRKQFYTEQGPVTDPYKANHKLASSFYKIIIKQLVGYLLGNGVTLTSPTQNAMIPLVQDILGKKFNNKVSKWATEAAKTGVGWLHPYIDDMGKFQYDIIPSDQVAFHMEADNDSEIDKVVRFYTINYEGTKTECSEVWSETDVTYYYKKGDKWVLCGVYAEGQMEDDDPTMVMVNPQPHITRITRYGDRVENITGQGWGKVPFIPLWFDGDKSYQLKPIKRHIDGYDIVQSDFMNNLDDIQDAFWILKGYEGEDLMTFMQDVKRYKALKVGEGGDAHTETVEIPTEAREKMLSALRKDIFFFGMAVDPDQVGDGNITNVVIKSRYANLDLKANDFEYQVEEAIQELMWFVNAYMSIYNMGSLDDYELGFNRSMVINEVETMEMVSKQKGIVSEQTFYEHHPWTMDNVEEEMNRLEGDMEKNPVTILEPLPNKPLPPEKDKEEKDDMGK